MKVRDQLLQSGVAKRGHWVLRSKQHAVLYIEKEKIILDPPLFRRVTISLTNQCNEFDYDLVTGPAVVGAILAAPLAFLAGKPLIFPEKTTMQTVGKMTFREVYQKVIPNKHVLIVEDIVTTGGSINLVIKAVEELGGIVAAVVAIWNRQGFQPNSWTGHDFSGKPIPFVCLINENVDSWTKDICPACAEGIPLLDPKTGLQVAI